MKNSEKEPLKPLIFVTGKGGVGKSTIAASMAYGLSLLGKRVLLVEFGQRSFFEKFFQTDPIQFKPREVSPNLSIAIWDYISCLREYIGFYVRSEKLFDLFFSHSVIQKFILGAPSLKELALLGKATSQPRKVGPLLNFDHIVIDSYSSGHHQALLKAPFGMSEVVRQGPMGVHSRDMVQVLQDSRYTQHYVVLKPEELPVVEGLELHQALRSEFQVDSEIIVNQVWEFPKLKREPLTEIEKYYSYEASQQTQCLKMVEEVAVRRVPYYLNREDPKRFLKDVFESLWGAL